ncbi:MAG TPA: response regulator [Acidimicrobiales bacterium]|nr:response regulator [Acidimicrobiales bacterium]
MVTEVARDSGRGDGDGRGKVRVVVVDDMDDVRLLLRMALTGDGRFEVVGEAANGAVAVDIVARLRPDLVVLDRHMPVMGGLEALPEIRRRSPESQVVLYTAAATPSEHSQAIASGAVGVVDKMRVGHDLVEDLARILVGGPEDAVEVTVGPVPSAAARLWVENTRRLLRCVEEHPEVVETDAGTLALYRSFLDTWADVASSTEEFLWVGRAPASDVSRLVEEWARIDALTDEQLEAVGCSWAPPEAAPFFVALTEGVLDALGRRGETRTLGERLSARWRPGS